MEKIIPLFGNGSEIKTCHQELFSVTLEVEWCRRQKIDIGTKKISFKLGIPPFLLWPCINSTSPFPFLQNESDIIYITGPWGSGWSIALETPIEFSYQWQPSREIFLLNPTFSLPDKSKGIYLLTTVFLEIPVSELSLKYLNFIFVNNTLSILSP